MEKTIGIIGGLGPYAGLDISKKVFDQTEVSSDRGHINQILMSFSSRVPDRSDYLLNNIGENPAIAVNNQINQLIDLGAEVIAIACNQMHSNQIWSLIESHIESKKNIKALNIVDEVVRSLKLDNNKKKIGIIARSGVIEHKIYSSKLEQNRFDIFFHSEEWQERIDDCIANENYGIKIQPNPLSSKVIETLNSFLDFLASNGVENIIMACTEIPLAINKDEYPNFTFIDSSEILAKALVRHAAPEKLKQC